MGSPPTAATGSFATTRVLRQASASAVLDALWQPQALTGTDLMHRTGLNRATVHDVCAELITLGWIEELDDQRAYGDYRRGRPARRYGLRDRAGVVIGIEVSTSRCTVLVADLLGRLLARADRTAPPDPDGRRAAAAAALDQALASAEVPTADVLACTIALPVPISVAGELAVRSNPFWTTMEAGLADHLGGLLPCPVRVVNDANSAAVAEGRLGVARGVDHHITLLVDSGFGAGVVTDGSLVRGRWGRGGEMRWLDLVSEVRAPIGLVPLLAYWADQGADAPPPMGSFNDATIRSSSMPDDLEQARRVLRAAEQSEPGSRAVLLRVGRHLAQVITMTAGVLDPEIVVLAGELAPDLRPLIAVVEDLLPRYLDDPVPRVVSSELGRDVVALGAVHGSLDDVHRTARSLRSTSHR